MNTTVIVLISVSIVLLFCRKFVELFAEDSYNALKNKISRRKRNNFKVIKVKKKKLSLKEGIFTLETVEIDLNPLK